MLVQETQLKLNSKDSKERTCLHYAFKTKNLDLIKLLLTQVSKGEAEKLILAQDKDMNTPFSLFFKSKNDMPSTIKLAEVLIESLGK